MLGNESPIGWVSIITAAVALIIVSRAFYTKSVGWAASISMGALTAFALACSLYFVGAFSFLSLSLSNLICAALTLSFVAILPEKPGNRLAVLKTLDPTNTARLLKSLAISLVLWILMNFSLSISDDVPGRKLTVLLPFLGHDIRFVQAYMSNIVGIIFVSSAAVCGLDLFRKRRTERH